MENMHIASLDFKLTNDTEKEAISILLAKYIPHN